MRLLALFAKREIMMSISLTMATFSYGLSMELLEFSQKYEAHFL
jgi:hypothetical protein